MEDIFRTLEWLGLDWDEGPESVEEHYNIYSQRFRIDKYNHLLTHLIEKADVFACSCSRKDINEQSENHQYPGTCRSRKLPLDTYDSRLRLVTPDDLVLSIPDIKNPSREIKLYDIIRDPVIRRRDGIPAYHIASLSDDIENEISLIIRGEDLLPSTALHLHMAGLLNEKSFLECKFLHHKLITEESGNKLSKSAGSTSIKFLREQGKDSSDFYRWVSRELGVEELGSLHELLSISENGTA